MRFLKAFSYFMLTRAYGEIPLFSTQESVAVMNDGEPVPAASYPHTAAYVAGAVLLSAEVAVYVGAVFFIAAYRAEHEHVLGLVVEAALPKVVVRQQAVVA